ncbi:MAG: hypothetical protein COB08_004300 [Rhodobacteraceae bacterium]|nr:hypothetical protein [Paracoccaceae bacterium]
MINSKPFTPSHIYFILGMWKAYMGGDQTLEIATINAEIWCKEIRKCGLLARRRVGSKWNSDHSITIMLNEQGKFRSFCWDEIHRLKTMSNESVGAARRFRDAVNTL